LKKLAFAFSLGIIGTIGDVQHRVQAGVTVLCFDPGDFSASVDWLFWSFCDSAVQWRKGTGFALRAVGC
jgi:hypothetical protein